jgi:integrase
MKSVFHIDDIRNPGGSIAYKVSGMLFGRQVREQYKTRELALTRKYQLELEAAKGPNQQSRITWLSASQVTAAEAAATLIKDKFPSENYSLVTVAQYFVSKFKANKTEHTLQSIFVTYLASKKEDGVSDVQLRNISYVMRRAAAKFPTTALHDFTSEMFTEWFKELQLKPKNWRNHRADLSAFFAWAMSKPRQWIPENPIVGVAIPELPMNVPKIVSAQTAQKIMAYVETIEDGCLSAIYALLLFAGIRPHGEMGRIAEAVESGRSDEIFASCPEQIYLGPEITKTGSPRWIEIEDNLRKWLVRYQPNSRHFDMRLYHRYAAKINKKFDIPKNAFRHNFDSFYAKKHGAVKTNDAAGHNQKVAAKHYRNLGITKEDLELFWGIQPK